MADAKETGAFRAPGRERSAQSRLSHAMLAELRHRADLALFAETAPSRWSDALLAETRFHLSGTLNAVEMAIRLEVADGDIEVRLAGLGQSYCRLALERQLALLSPELLGHFRLRGALSMILRGETGYARPDNENLAMEGHGDGPFAQMLAALALAEQRWVGPMLLDAPLRPDLPAEPFCELAWTAAALLIDGLARARGNGDRDAAPAIVHAVQRVIARHDEGSGPLALAQRCARALGSQERQRFASLALHERRLLLFAALVEAETAIPLETVVSELIDGGDAARHAILKLMGIDVALAVAVFEMLAPLAGGAADGDVALARFVEDFRTVQADDVEAWLDKALVPSALVAKLSLIEPGA